MVFPGVITVITAYLKGEGRCQTDVRKILSNSDEKRKAIKTKTRKTTDFPRETVSGLLFPEDHSYMSLRLSCF